MKTMPRISVVQQNWKAIDPSQSRTSKASRFFFKRKWISLQMSEEKAGRFPRYSEEDMFLLSTKNPKAIGNAGGKKMFNDIMVQIGSKCTYGRIMIN